MVNNKIPTDKKKASDSSKTLSKFLSGLEFYPPQDAEATIFLREVVNKHRYYINNSKDYLTFREMKTLQSIVDTIPWEFKEKIELVPPAINNSIPHTDAKHITITVNPYNTGGRPLLVMLLKVETHFHSFSGIPVINGEHSSIIRIPRKTIAGYRRIATAFPNLFKFTLPMSELKKVYTTIKLNNTKTYRTQKGE